MHVEQLIKDVFGTLSRTMSIGFAACVVAAAALATFSGSPIAGATTVHATVAPVRFVGTIVEINSSSSLTVDEKSRLLLVKTDDMTHIKLGTKSVKLSALKPGDTVVVAGQQETRFVSATSVAAESGMGLVSYSGILSKVVSSSSFTINLGTLHELVKTDDVTHIKLGTKFVKVASLKVGDHLGVAGHQEAGFVLATNVVIYM